MGNPAGLGRRSLVDLPVPAVDRRTAGTVLVILAAIAAAALWPLSAYALSPALLPLAVAALGIAAVAITRPEAGIALALAAVPFRGVEAGGVYPLPLLLPALAFGLLAYALLTLDDRRGLRSGGFVAAVVVLLAALTASAIQALEPSRSVGEIARLATAIALVFAALRIATSPRHLLILAVGAVTGLLLAGAYGLFQQSQGMFSDVSFAAGGEEVKRIQGTFGHPNQYAGYLATLIPLAGSLAVARRMPAGVRWLGAAAVAIAIPALALTYTRGAVVALVAGTVAWLVVVRPRAAVAAVVVFGLGFAVASPAAVKERLQSVNSDEVQVRQDQWGAALAIYSEHPVLGVGIDNFGVAYARLPSSVPSASQRRLLHNDQLIVPPDANSLYLTNLAEIGTLGSLAMALVALLAVAAAFRGTRGTDPTVRAVSIGLGAGILALAAHNILEVTLFEVSEPILVLVAMVAGLNLRTAGELVLSRARPAKLAGAR